MTQTKHDVLAFDLRGISLIIPLAYDKSLRNSIKANNTVMTANLELAGEGRLQDDDHNLSAQCEEVLQVLRVLVADLCQQFGAGHGGSAIGMAAIGVALWKYVMRYAPHTPDFYDRDRFILSNGHACLLQYLFLHITGYKSMTLDHLQSYRSTKPNSNCPAHPEIDIEGVEVTTGALGQGIANSVGMAIAAKHIGATYNRPGFELISNHIWCLAGDACLQEGVALEAISLAGHLRLNNLTIIYDNNQTTCDGSVNIANTEDINAKMMAMGWHTIDITDGSFDVDGLVSALAKARGSLDKPTFLNVRTIIGVGTPVARTNTAHYGAFGVDNVAKMKKAYGLDPEKHFTIPDTVKDFFADCVPRGAQRVLKWEHEFKRYNRLYPILAEELSIRLQGKLPMDWQSYLPTSFPTTPTSSRTSSALILAPLFEKVNSFMAGSADLSSNMQITWNGICDFQNPLLHDFGVSGNYSGRNIRYGIREHAMVAIGNGIAAYHPNMIIPVTSSFLVFYLYAAAAVRMGALQRLQVIHIATYDSIGLGESGPTHQPIEVAALFRAMPNFLFIRPGDSEETAGAWIAAIEARNTPCMISTSRHTLPQLAPKTNRLAVLKGAYVLEEEEEANVTIIGVGAELGLAMDVAERLRTAFELRVRVVSFPCHRLFEYQSVDYRRNVLRRNSGLRAVVIEPYTTPGWERYADAAIGLGTERFGVSLPREEAYRFFGFETGIVAKKISRYLDDIKSGVALINEFHEL